MPNDWTPQPPYPFDAPGKVDTPSGRARRQMLKAAIGAVIVAAAGILGWKQLSMPAGSHGSGGGKRDDGAASVQPKFAIGSAAQLMRSPGPTPVTVNSQQAFVEFTGGKPSVLSAVCPHQGCLVEWQAGASKFVCPCHDSEFARDGSLLQGPSKEPLAVLTSAVVNGMVYVDG